MGILTCNVLHYLGSSSTEGTAKNIQIKAWLDGAALTQTYAAKEAAFSFSFEARQAAPQE